MKSGVETQSRSGVNVVSRRGDTTRNATAVSSHDSNANSLDTVEGAEVEVGNNRLNLRNKEKGFIPTSRNMVDVEALVGLTWRGV